MPTYIHSSIIFVILLNMLTHLFAFFIGVGAFLYGLTMIASSTMVFAEKLFSVNTNRRLLNPFMAIGISFLATSVIQSSAATNSISVKLADDKIVDMKTALFFIMGSNIGTTTTAYISILAKFFLSYVFASLILVGTLLYMIAKNDRLKNIAHIICSLAFIFIGLIFINSACLPIYEKVYQFIQNKNSNLYLFVFAMLMTAIFQSSSLTSTLLVTMATVINIKTAIIMVMGINVGTCFSVMLASIGCSAKGWIVVLFHFFFNVIGVIVNVFMLKTGLLSFLLDTDIQLNVKIALYHTFFNVSTTVFLFYFIPEIAKLLDKFVKKPKVQSFLLSI